MRLEVGADRRCRVRIPNDEHGVLTSISCHDPVLVLTTKDACDLVAMALKQLLLLGDIVVDDASVRSRVEDLRTLVIGQEVYTLVNVLVETIHFVQGLGR